MNNSHIKSTLALKNISHPIDEHTKALFHYNWHAISHDGTIKPLGPDPEDENCIGYWDFSREQEIAYDLSGNDNHGSIVGATWGNGRNGKALSFDGADDYIELSRPLGNLFSNSFTVSMWCYFNDDSRGILFGDLQRPNAISVNLEKYTNRTLRFYWANSPNIYSPTNVVPLQEWCLITFVRDKEDSKVFIYVNGEIVHTYDGAVTDKVAQSLHRIGRDNRTGTTALDGLVSKFMLYERALSPEEIQAHYNEGIYTLRPDGKYGGAIAVEKGTVNLISKPDFSSGWTIAGTPGISDGVLTFTGSGTNTSGYAYQDLTLPSGTYTLSYWAKTVNAENVDNSGDGGPRVRFASIVNFVLPPNQDWAYFSHTLTTTGGRLEFSKHDMTSGGIFMVKEPQLELSSFPTSFVDGAREDGKIIYNIPLGIEWTFSEYVKNVNSMEE